MMGFMGSGGVCVCVGGGGRERACASACVCVCVRTCVHVCVSTYVMHACVCVPTCDEQHRKMCKQKKHRVRAHKYTETQTQRKTTCLS
jgi:hypothetical protein